MSMNLSNFYVPIKFKILILWINILLLLFIIPYNIVFPLVQLPIVSVLYQPHHIPRVRFLWAEHSQNPRTHHNFFSHNNLNLIHLWLINSIIFPFSVFCLLFLLLFLIKLSLEKTNYWINELNKKTTIINPFCLFCSYAMQHKVRESKIHKHLLFRREWNSTKKTTHRFFLHSLPINTEFFF